MANLLKNLEVSCVSLVNRAAVRDPSNPSQPQRLLLWKAEDHPTPGGVMPTATEELAAALTKADLPDSVREALTKAQERETALAKATEDLAKATADMAALTAKVTELEKAGKTEPEPTVDLSKADPAIRAMLEKAEAEGKALAERVEKAEAATAEADKLAKAERDARVTREFVTKAEAYKALVIKAEEFGPVLKSVAEKLTKEEAEAIDTVLKAADAQISASELFKEQGAGGRVPAADSALAEVQRKAEELKKSDPTLSDAKALEKAMDSDRELQRRYLAEVQG